MSDWFRRLIHAGGLLGSDTRLNQRSQYEASVQRPPPSPPLQGEHSADVAVVGGGFAGLSAAIKLAQRGRRVVLLEADRVGSGASGRNGGQVIVGYACGQGPFEQQLGEADARTAWDLSLAAVELVDQRVREHGIDCGWTRGYLTVADSPRKARALLADAEQLAQHYGLAQDVATGADVERHIQSPRYVASVRETVSGHLHPLAYALGLQRVAQQLGVHVFEHSPVQRLVRAQGPHSRHSLHTPQGRVNAQQVVLAGNCMLPEWGPQVAPELAARIMPVGTYLVATEPLDEALARRLIPANDAVCDNNVVLDYFRFSPDHRLLFGGRVSYTTQTPKNLKEIMRRRMVDVFPPLQKAKIEYVWGGFVDISMNRAPDFGRLAPDVYYLQGFSGHGVALTGLAGQLVAQAVAGESDGFDLFTRLQHRAFPGGPLLRTPTLALGMLWHRLLHRLG